MAVAADPRLLVPRGGEIPARLVLDDLAGRPGVVRVEGPAGSWAGLKRLGPAERDLVARFTREAVALVVAVDPGGGLLPRWLADCVDMVAPGPDTARAWEHAFTRAPAASMAATLLSRRRGDDLLDGLLAESATYSMLQSGEGLQAWLARHPVRPAEPDTSPRLQAQTVDGVRWITLSRPARHNALDRRLRDELHSELLGLNGEAALVVVLEGDGPSFCSGGDLGEFGTFESPVAAHFLRVHRSLALDFAALASRMVVGLHGACLGAGVELPAFAARVVASDDVRIGLPEAALGLVPGAGGTVSIPRRIGSARFLELLFGDPVDAPTALEWGLVDEVVARRDLRRRLSELATSARRALLASIGGAA